MQTYNKSAIRNSNMIEMLSCGVSDRADERSNTGVGALLSCGVSDVQKTKDAATQRGSNQLQNT